MKNILFIAMLLFSVLVMGQDTNQNHTKAITYKKPSTGGSVDLTDPSKAIVQVAYYDGLGRPIQQIVHKQSANSNDIVTHMEYDAFGRQIKEFLPYEKTPSLSYSTSANSDVLNFYNDADYENTTNPYSEKLLENSPLSRLFEQAAPGNDWALNNHTIKFTYDTNVDEEVKLFRVSLTLSSRVYGPTLNDGGEFYAANQLYKTITRDENGVPIEEFKDKQGKVILKRSYNGGEKHDTYYVYDVYGNLTYVIPPLADGYIDNIVLDGLCYQYKYDYRNRLVEKKLPGKSWEFIVYDKLDRVVATGPALNPFGSGETGWLITKYDAFNRVAYTGWFNHVPATAEGRSIMYQEYLDSVTLNEVQVDEGTFQVDNYSISHSNKVFPDNGSSNGGDYRLLTVNYYDSYNYYGGPTVPNVVSGGQEVYFNNTDHPKGLITGTWSRILTTPEDYFWEKSYTLYDKKARPVRTHTTNEYLGGYTQVDSEVDFSGKTIATETRHKYSASSSELMVNEAFEYTPQDKLLLHKHLVSGEYEQLITKNTYDALGELTSKNVGGWDITGATGLQKVDYKYNIRGWLKSINDVSNNVTENDLFAFKINYNTVEFSNHGTFVPLYNGNISETFWMSKSDDVLRKYGYQYDHLNRLTNAVYQKPNGTVPVPNSYNESMSYDKNGNIMTLSRNGNQDSNQLYLNALTIDELQYTYDDENPNRLLKVMDGTANFLGFRDDSDGLSDAADDYEYDDFGNMTRDDNKDITKIFYNHLNLPLRVEFVSGNSINYIYTANGHKFQKQVIDLWGSDGSVTEYLNGGFQYKDGQLKFFPHPEGYVNVTVGGQSGTSTYYNYVFNYTDHLGNIRLSYGADPEDINTVKIIEENHYYPFGLKHTNYNSDVLIHEFEELSEMVVLRRPPSAPVTPSYKYKYNGKELQDELGLNVYDYGWRQYDPAIARFNRIDRFAEKYSDKSPYNYGANNPVYYVEVAGDSINVNNLNKTKEGKYILRNLMYDLGKITGLNFSVNSNGNLISSDGERDADGNLSGSASARSYIKKILSDTKNDITLENDNTKTTQAYGRGMVNINSDQVDNNIFSTESAGFDELTYGYGFTFIHESIHTGSGTRAINPNATRGIDDDLTNSQAGPTETIVNTYRNQLYLPQRNQYNWQQQANSSAPPTMQFINTQGKKINVSQIPMPQLDKDVRRSN